MKNFYGRETRIKIQDPNALYEDLKKLHHKSSNKSEIHQNSQGIKVIISNPEIRLMLPRLSVPLSPCQANVKPCWGKVTLSLVYKLFIYNALHSIKNKYTHTHNTKLWWGAGMIVKETKQSNI